MSTVPFTPKKDAERPDESTLTDRQRKVLGAIKKHLVEQGFAPSFREIGEAWGLKVRHPSNTSCKCLTTRASFA